MNSKFTKIVRVLLGVLLIVFGSNKFLHFLPLPEPTGTNLFFTYLFPVVGALEVFIGGMLLLKRWVGFVAILLAPISVNILMFHFLMDIPGIEIALLAATLNGILIYKHWALYRPLFGYATA